MEKSIKKTKGDNEDYPLLEGAVLNGAGVVKVIKKTKGEHKQIVQNFAKLCCNGKVGMEGRLFTSYALWQLFK